MNIGTQVNLRQLRAFVAVYRLRRLATAADHLALTQSAVSMLIRQLEDVLQTRLFDRSSRSLQPTAAADEAIEAAERILHDVSVFGESFHERASLQRGRIRIAVTPSVGLAVMPIGVRRFLEEYPHIQLIIDDCAPEQFLTRILTEQVDLGIGIPEQITAEIDAQVLEEDPLCIVCTEDHKLARYAEVRWAQLHNVPIVALRGGYGVRRLVDTTAQTVGVHLRIVNEASFSTSALWMAASGIGVAILPSYLAASALFPNLIVRSLVGPQVARPVYAITRKGRSLPPAGEKFVDIMQQVLARRA